MWGQPPRGGPRTPQTSEKRGVVSNLWLDFGSVARSVGSVDLRMDLCNDRPMKGSISLQRTVAVFCVLPFCAITCGACLSTHSHPLEDAGRPDAPTEADGDSPPNDSGVDGFLDAGSCILEGSLVERRELIRGASFLEDIYASTVLVHDGKYHMWYSGWRSSEDYPYDKIFHATSSNGLDWEAPDLPAFELDGAVADPSVIFQESKGRFIMAFSYIHDPEKWHGLSPENYDLDDDENYLHVWSAESLDGESWNVFGELVGRSNGYDETAAWAPSVLAVDDDQAHVYYNNDPNFVVHPEHRYLILRSIVDLAADPMPERTDAAMSDGVLRANVDVSVHDEGLLMLYNRILADPVRRYSVGALFSLDGEAWQEMDASLLRPEGTDQIDIATPHFFTPSAYPAEWWVFVGEGDQSSLRSSVCLWRYASSCWID